MDAEFEQFVKKNVPQDKALGAIDVYLLVQKAWEAGRLKRADGVKDETEEEKFERQHGPHYI